MKAKDLLNRLGFFKFNESIYLKRLLGTFYVESINKKIRLIDHHVILIILDYKNLKFNRNLSQFIIDKQIFSKYVIL